MHTLTDRNTRGKFLILVEVDFSEKGPSVLEAAVDLASTTPDAELHLVFAFGPAIRADNLRSFPALWDFTSIEDADAAGAALHRIAALLPLEDIRICAHVHEGSATTVISKLAEDIEADLVVVGNHDRAGVNPFFGSVAEKLVRMAPCPVLIVQSKSIPSSAPIAPPCQACEASKRLTWGVHVRCLDHAPPDAGTQQTPSTFDLSA